MCQSEPFNPDQFNRRVLEARWIDNQYAVRLDCGHTFTCSESFLSSPLACMDCVRAALAAQKAARVCLSSSGHFRLRFV